MLKKSQKLNSKEHKKLVSSGKIKHGKFLMLQLLNNDEEITKCAVVVSKKIHKSAVKRNQNRRKVFDILQNIYPQLKQGYLFAFVVRKNIDELSQEELTQEISFLLNEFIA